MSVHAGIVFAAGLLIKLALLICYPELYGGDTVFHLRNHQRLTIGHQPPMLQVLINLTYRLSTNPIAPRLLMVLIGATAGVGFYLMCTRILDQTAALWGALFVVTNPFLNEISLVPFQEVLMAGLLFFSIYFLWSDKVVLSGVLLGLACWTRYEAWIVCPVLAGDYLIRKGWTLKNGAGALTIFAAGPILWIGLHHGLSSPGAYAVEMPRSPVRMMRWVYLAWVCMKQTPIPVLICAAICAWRGFVNRRAASPHRMLVVGFVLLYLAATLAAAHGIGHPGMPNPELFLSAREATLLVCFTLLLASVGFAQLMRDTTLRGATSIIGITAITLGVFQSWLLVRSQASQREISLDYQVATYLSAHVDSSAEVLFVAKPFSAGDWSYYLEQAERLQGAAGLKAANNSLRQADLSPMDFQRTAVQVNLPESHMRADQDSRKADWIVWWSNATPPQSVSATLESFDRVWSIEKADLTVTIWKRRCPRLHS